MSLTEALAALKAAGKIKSAWLPGMLVQDEDDNSQWMRCGALDDHSAAWWFDQDDDLINPVDHMTLYRLGIYRIVMTDPATRGCAQALVEEVLGHPVEVSQITIGGVSRWMVWDPEADLDTPGEVGPDGSDAGEALARALIALAEAQ